jgi:hypothetical protein
MSQGMGGVGGWNMVQPDVAQFVHVTLQVV